MGHLGRKKPGFSEKAGLLNGKSTQNWIPWSVDTTSRVTTIERNEFTVRDVWNNNAMPLISRKTKLFSRV